LPKKLCNYVLGKLQPDPTDPTTATTTATTAGAAADPGADRFRLREGTRRRHGAGRGA
jgi:hypothetical protein